MSILNKFTEWGEKRLRLSQIKILYQNQAALEFVSGEIEPGIAMNDDNAIAMKKDLDFFKLATDNAIVELSYKTILQEPASTEMLEINKALRLSYSGFAQGKQAFKAMMGDSAGENTPFEKRFMPAVGWKNLGDSEWDKMMSKALGEPQ